MIETLLLALVITLKGWHILTIISSITFIIAVILDSQIESYYIPVPPIYCGLWLFVNLIMWLIYFIIV